MKKLNLMQNQNFSLFKAINILKTSAALLLFSAGLQSVAYAGQGGDGGAGVHKNGQYMTFYSAGVTILGEKSADEIPGLQETINAVSNPNLFSAETAGDILISLLPSDKRTYYDIDPSQFDKETEKRLIAIYAKATGQPIDKLTLYAVTDPKTRETFLFPNFYKLKKISQQAILFHESRWILQPYANYKQIIREEMAFEKYITNPNDLEAQYELTSKVGSTTELLQFATYADKLTGAINDNSQLQYKGKTLTLNPANLFGAEFFVCQKIKATYNYNSFDSRKLCLNEFLIHVINLQSQYPNSFLLNFIKNQISSNQIRIYYFNKRIMSYKSHFLQSWPLSVTAYTYTPAEIARDANSKVMQTPFLINMSPQITRLATLNPNWENQSNESWTDIVDIVFLK